MVDSKASDPKATSAPSAPHSQAPKPTHEQEATSLTPTHSPDRPKAPKQHTRDEAKGIKASFADKLKALVDDARENGGKNRDRVISLLNEAVAVYEPLIKEEPPPMVQVPGVSTTYTSASGSGIPEASKQP